MRKEQPENRLARAWIERIAGVGRDSFDTHSGYYNTHYGYLVQT